MSYYATNIDLENPALETALRTYLEPDDARSNKVEFCGIALVGFELGDYDKLCEESAAKNTAAIAARADKWGKVKSAVEKNKLISVTIDAFCTPLLEVEKIREEFLRVLGVRSAVK